MLSDRIDPPKAGVEIDADGAPATVYVMLTLLVCPSWEVAVTV